MSDLVFLSTVASEFGELHQRLETLLQQTKRLQVRHYDDFGPHGVKTLEKLEQEVANSQVVLHVLGAQPGARPPVSQVKAFLARFPSLEQHYPKVAADARQGLVSYTQWEAWLALLLGKKLYLYQLKDETDKTPSQQRHAQRLRDAKIYPNAGESNDALFDEIYLTLANLNTWAVCELLLPRAKDRMLLGNKFTRAFGTFGSGDEAPEDPIGDAAWRVFCRLVKFQSSGDELLDAEWMVRRFWASAEAFYGAEHKKVAPYIDLLVWFLTTRNRPYEAESLLRRAITIYEMPPLDKEWNVLRHMQSLAHWLFKTNRSVEANRLLYRLMDLYECKFGSDEWQFGNCILAIIESMGPAISPSDAGPHVRRALAIVKKTTGGLTAKEKALLRAHRSNESDIAD